MSESSLDEKHCEVEMETMPVDCNSLDCSSLSLSDSPGTQRGKGNVPIPKPVKPFQSFTEVLCHGKQFIADCMQTLQHEQSLLRKKKVMCELRQYIADTIGDGFPVKPLPSEHDKLLRIVVELNTEKIVYSSILKYQVPNLTEDDVDYLVNCFWILTTIASSRTHSTKAAVNADVVPFAIDIVRTSPLIPLVNQCLSFLFKSVENGEELCKEFLYGGLVERVHSMFHTVDQNYKAHIVHLYLKVYRSAQLYLSQDIQEQMYIQAISLLNPCHTLDVLHPVVVLIDMITSDRFFKPKNFLDVNCTLQLVSCVSHSDSTVRNRCLLSVGHLLLGNDQQIWAVLKTGLLTHLVALLYHDDIETVKNTLWILSSIAGGDEQMMYSFFDFNLFQPLLFYLGCEHPKLVHEAMFIIGNLTRYCDSHIRRTYILQCRDLIKTMVMLLDNEVRLGKSDPAYNYLCIDVIGETFSVIFSFLQSESLELQTSCKEIYSELGVGRAFRSIVDTSEDTSKLARKMFYIRQTFQNLLENYGELY